TPPGTGTPITVSQNVTVPASTSQTVQFTPGSFPALNITSPQVWWPYQLGAQPLYTLTAGVARAFKINGVPIVIRGGGYDPNLFLHYSAADTASQVALMKNMGLNAIRL